MPRAEFAQRLQERGLRRDEIHVAGDRLDDHRRDLVALLPSNARSSAMIVVVVEHERVHRRLGRHARRARLAERERARSRFHEQRIGVAVIAAFELDDLRAAGEAAREPDRAHRRFGARAHEPHLLERRHELHSSSAISTSSSVGAPKERPCAAARVTASTTSGCAWPSDERPPRADVVDVARAVGVPHERAFAALEEQRRAADCAESAHRRIHAARRARAARGRRGAGCCFIGSRSRTTRPNARAAAAMSAAREQRRDHRERVGAGFDERCAHSRS